MFEFLRRLFGLGRTPASQPAPRPTPTSPVPPAPAPIPITPLAPDPITPHGLTLTRHDSKWGESVMVTLKPGAPEVFIRHVLADGTHGQDAGGRTGALLGSITPAVRVSIRPGSVIEWRPTGTDESAFRVLARY